MSEEAAQTTETESTPEGVATASSTLATPDEGSSTPDTSSSTDSKWFGDLSSDDLQYIQSKGWDKEGKGPQDVIKAYRNLDRLRGVSADKLVKLPDPNNEEEVAQFRSRLGVPDSPEGYETTTDLTVGNDEIRVDVLAKMAHKAGMSNEAFNGFTEDVKGWLMEEVQLQQEARAERNALEAKQLDQEWGQQKDANYQAARQAASRFEVSAEQLDAIEQGLGYKGTIELFARIGRAFGEGKPADPAGTETGSPFGMTPSSAQAQIDKLTADAGFRQKLLDGDAQAQEKWDRLKKIAFGG